MSEKASKPDWLMYGVLAVAVLCLALVAGVSLSTALHGKPAPDFAGRTTHGDVVRLADYKGKVVVVDFWGTWCPPCVEAIPELKAFQKEYEPLGVQVIGVSADFDAKALQDFEVQNEIPYPTIFEGAPEIIDMYGVRVYPTVVVIDRDGKVRAMGHIPDLRKEVAPLL